jgi:hypothetical protein
MIDKKGRIFGVVSLVDLFAVVMVGAIVAFVYFNVGSARFELDDEQAVLITFFHPTLEDFTVHAVDIGAPVINDANETFMGYVVGVDIADSISFMPDIHGMEVASPMQGYSSIAITSRVYGRISGGAVVLGGNIYGVGTEIIIWAGRAKTMLHISDVRVEDLT